MNKLGIDVATRSKKQLISRLGALKTTLEVQDGGEYWMDRYYSQVHVNTQWREDELDDWLYNTKFKNDFEYVGVFQMEGG